MLPKVFILIVASLIIIKNTLAQVEFQERFDTDKKKANLAGRLPLYSPTRCKHDELLYPGDQFNDWICDCAPAALFHPDTDACYPAFRQGPCEAEHFLVLRPGSVIPECVPNACKVDGKVLINGQCYQFGGNAPCRNPDLSYVLGVDPATLMVDCVRLSLSVATRLGDSDPSTPNTEVNNLNICLRGSKRVAQGQCHVK